MKTNFVLVDFENVQPKDIALLKGGPFGIKVFVGGRQGSVPLEMARTLQSFGPDAEYLQIEGSGHNALDFHIAYYIGRLAAENPEAHFHIVSKDTGFDPLVRHVERHGISCVRVTTIGDIPLLKGGAAKPARAPRPAPAAKHAPAAKPAPAAKHAPTAKHAAAKNTLTRIDTFAADLAKPKTAKPRTLNTLISAIKSRFANQLTDGEVDEIILGLTKHGVVKIADGKVSYDSHS
jgi:hypothetical protein